MKVLHFFLGKANPDRANGVNQVINGYGKYLTKNGASVTMIGLSKLDNKKSNIFLALFIFHLSNNLIKRKKKRYK